MRSIVLAAILGLCCGTIEAAEAPRSAKELFADADAVVIADVADVAIRKQRSAIESGFGNYDWIVTCALRIRSVEKGKLSKGDEIAAECFVVHTRKSALECLSLQGHSPIPETGQSVRAYLRKSGTKWLIIHPNGFASVGQNAIQESKRLQSLSQGGFTYLLPLELWGLVFVGGFVLWGLFRLLAWICIRFRRSDCGIPLPS